VVSFSQIFTKVVQVTRVRFEHSGHESNQLPSIDNKIMVAQSNTSELPIQNKNIFPQQL